MNRLQRKCFLASAALHGLLLLLLATGAAFVASRTPPVDSMAILTYVPDALVDAAVSGGGEPVTAPQPPAKAQPPAVQSAPPPPQTLPPPRPVKPQVRPELQPPPEKVVKPAKPEPEPDRASAEGTRKVTPPKTHRVELDRSELTRTIRTTKPPPKEDPALAEVRAAAEAAEQSRRIAAARQSRINSIVSGIQSRLTSTTTITSPGPGGGGVSYANYGLFVRSVYELAWQPPQEMANDTATATARIVIARDAHIVSADLVTSSGIAPLDKSVNAALKRVTTIGRPFPAGATEETRTFFIDFNLQSKRHLG